MSDLLREEVSPEAGRAGGRRRVKPMAATWDGRPRSTFNVNLSLQCCYRPAQLDLFFVFSYAWPPWAPRSVAKAAVQLSS